MRLVAIAVSLLLACASSQRPRTSSTASRLEAAPARTCETPVDHGAVADGPDAREAFMRALAAIPAAGGTLCIPPGRFTLTRAPAGSYNRFAALSTHAEHVVIAGAGPETVLVVTGDQGFGSTNVISVDPGARGVHIRDLTIDTSGMYNTDEQTHAIAIGTSIGAIGPVTDVLVERVRFIHPPPADGRRKGDCIRLLGNTPALEVRNVRIVGSTFTSCARSSIAMQRNVNALKIIGNYFASPSADQQIDGEATGGEWDEDLAIIGNTFDDVPSNQGDFAVALTSQRKAHIVANTFRGRGLFLYRTTDTHVLGNTFDANMRTGYGVIDASNVSDGLVIQGNTVRRHGTAGWAIRVTPHSGQNPSSIAIADNNVELDSDSGGVYLESPVDAAVTGNRIRFTAAAPNGSGVFVRAIARPADGIDISHNRIVSTVSLYAAVRLGASPQPFDGATVTGNTHRGPGTSLRCEGGVGMFRQPIVSGLNRWATLPACIAATFTGGQ
jgi:hypothetical protein